MTKADPRYAEILQGQECSVCTTCFRLTSLGKFYQHCKCEPTPAERPKWKDCPSGFNLCILCARTLAGGMSRWSWLACDQCITYSNHKRILRSSLPLGRHSLMNGEAWAIQVETVEERKEQVDQMLKFIDLQSELYEFSHVLAKEMFEQEPTLKGMTHVPLLQWRELFPPSLMESKIALEKFRSHMKNQTKGMRIVKHPE